MFIPFLKKPERNNSIEKISRTSSLEAVKENFLHTVKNNPQRAAELINSRNLQFTSLFVLENEIKKTDLLKSLNTRNKQALEYVNGNMVSHDYDQDYHSLLKWILETGYRNDGLDNHYDEVLDNAAIILAKVYKDKQCLPVMEEMIFNRYRRGAFIYDLVWAYFEVAESDNLIKVAERLMSSNQKDVELARKFLNFIPCINTDMDPVKKYNSSVKWIKDNKDYISYTGETFLQTNNPVRYSVSLEAKYLQRPVASISSEQTRSLPRYEMKSLECFKKLDDDLKLRLSDFSDMLNRQSRYKWSKWLQNPIDKQIEIMRQAMGGKQT